MKHMIIYSMLSFVGLYSISVVFVINEIHSLRQFDHRRLYIFRKKVKKEIKIKRWRKLQITYEKKITVAWIIKIFLRKNTTFIVFLSVFHIIFTDLNTGLYSVKKVLIKLSCFLSFTFYGNLKIMVSERKGQIFTIAEKSNHQIVLGLFRHVFYFSYLMMCWNCSVLSSCRNILQKQINWQWAGGLFEILLQKFFTVIVNFSFLIWQYIFVLFRILKEIISRIV